MHKYRTILFGSATLLINACTTTSHQSGKTLVVEDRIVPPAAQSSSAHPPQAVQTQATSISIPATPGATELPLPQKRSAAVVALLDSAEKQQQNNDYRSAQSTLQRAQRIAPRDPQIYYQLATTHLGLQSYELAEQVALKGISLVQGQPLKLKKFWNLIALIRLQAGNQTGAEAAQQTADKY